MTLREVRCGERRDQGLEAAARSVSTHQTVAAGRQLHQAELREERAFAQKFRVDADRRLRLRGVRASGAAVLASIDPNRVGHTIDPRVQFENLSRSNRTMLRLAKAFWDIALWRASPAQLPASRFLLCLVAAPAPLSK